MCAKQRAVRGTYSGRPAALKKDIGYPAYLGMYRSRQLTVSSYLTYPIPIQTTHLFLSRYINLLGSEISHPAFLSAIPKIPARSCTEHTLCIEEEKFFLPREKLLAYISMYTYVYSVRSLFARKDL